MKTFAQSLFTLCLFGLAGVCSASPVVQPLQFSSVVLGSNATLVATVSDPGGSLVSATLYVAGPATRTMGVTNWPGYQLAGSITLTGTQASPLFSWSPSQTGSYLVQILVSDMTGTTIQIGSIECVADRLTITPVTIASGADTMYIDPGEIATQENDAGDSVIAQSGANLIFWSGGRVDLKPGFHAISGSFFWAAVDHDMNGYSDVEESTQVDSNGIPIAWELDHGLTPAYDGQVIAGNNGMTILQLYQSQHIALPNGAAGVQLVLRTPMNSFYSVNPSTWAISGSN